VRSPCLSIDVPQGRRVRGRPGLMGWKFRSECEVVEQGLHFAGGVDVFCALGGGEALFQAGDSFVGAA